MCSPSHPLAGGAADRRAQPRIAEQRVDGRGEPFGVPFGHDERGLAMDRDRGDPAGVGGDHRGGGRQRLENRVGQAVDIARVVDPRGGGRHVRCRQPAGHLVVRDRPQPGHTVRDPPGRRPRAQLAVEVAVAGQHQSQRGAARGESREGVDEVLETLLPHEPADREDDLRVVVQAVGCADALPGVPVGREAVYVHPVQQRLRARIVRSENDRPVAQVGAAGGHPVGAPERGAGGDADQRLAFRHEQIGAVQADDDGQPPRRGGRGGAAGDGPVRMDQGWRRRTG